MTVHANTRFDDRQPPSATSRVSFGAHLRSLKGHTAAWAETCADYFQAALLYEDSSRLSDAELGRRGLRRASLGRDIIQTCDRTRR